ncbi:MAG: TatD family hydrolase [Flavobacteriales bacterium]|nr:TatD family hydrolase [Flavobacteriales bacterium]
MILTDTHTHLYSKQFNDDIDVVIQNCIAKGITRLFLPNIDSTSIEGMIELGVKYPNNCFPMMGLHPTSVNDNYKEELALVEDWMSKQKFCAIGEIGIDLYWDKTHLKEQQEAFRFQIELAKKYDLPFVIHCRDAFDEIFEILDKLNDDKMRGIFHCFTGTVEQANHIINYGDFKIGIGGVVTFKNSGLDKVLEQLELKHLVLETDSPYLAPTPFRGKRNESTYLYNIAEKVADIYNISIEEVAKVTTENSKQVFGF